MKKVVFASIMALASMSLVVAPKLQAQDLSIKDPAEFNAYQMASTQSDPKAKCAALDSFLKTYPQSVAKVLALDQMIDCYMAQQDAENAVKAATQLLQVDPNNLKATLYAVLIKKAQCAKSNGSDAQTCDDASALAQKGMTLTKPASMADDEWQKLTHAAFPIFHSAIALDDGVVKKDWKGAE